MLFYYSLDKFWLYLSVLLLLVLCLQARLVDNHQANAAGGGRASFGMAADRHRRNIGGSRRGYAAAPYQQSGAAPVLAQPYQQQQQAAVNQYKYQQLGTGQLSNKMVEPPGRDTVVVEYCRHYWKYSSTKN